MNSSRELALRRMMESSASLEHQFDKDAYRRPVLFLLVKAREQALKAFEMLVYSADPTDGATIRQLQHEIRRYDDLVDWCRQIIAEGNQADQLLQENDRMEFARAVLDPENADDLEAAGFNHEDTYADR